jgi:hypothetical protein
MRIVAAGVAPAATVAGRLLLAQQRRPRRCGEGGLGPWHGRCVAAGGMNADAPQPLLLQDHPIIETGVEIDDGDTDLEDYVASYGGGPLVDELRTAVRALEGSRRRDARPWTFIEPRTREHADYTVVFPGRLRLASNIAEPARRHVLGRALNHYHADRWRRRRRLATSAAAVPLPSAREGIAMLEFAVTRLGYKVVIVLPADHSRREPRARPPTFQEFWARAADLRVPVLLDVRTLEGTAFAISLITDVARSTARPPIGLIGGGLDLALPGITRLDPPAGPSAERTHPDFLWRAFERPYLFYASADPDFFEGTSLQDRLKARGHLWLTRAAEGSLGRGSGDLRDGHFLIHHQGQAGLGPPTRAHARVVQALQPGGLGGLRRGLAADARGTHEEDAIPCG